MFPWLPFACTSSVISPLNPCTDAEVPPYEVRLPPEEMRKPSTQVEPVVSAGFVVEVKFCVHTR
jgi:hypothetical protein